MWFLPSGISGHGLSGRPSEQAASTENRWAGALDSNSSTSPDKQTSRKDFFSDGELDLDPDLDAQDDDEQHDDSGLNIEGMELSDSFMNLGEDGENGLGEDLPTCRGRPGKPQRRRR